LVNIPEGVVTVLENRNQLPIEFYVFLDRTGVKMIMVKMARL